MEIKYCEVCGKPIPYNAANYHKAKTCSFNCRMEARRKRAREYNWTHRIREHGTVAAQYRHGTGWEYLAQAIVNTAIEDIRACSAKDIKHYEDAQYRTRLPRPTAKMYNYFDAKMFLQSQRVSGLTTLNGNEIYKMLLREKGIEL